MLFNSIVFLFAFLPLTFLLYFTLNHQHYERVAKLFLVLASLFFYAWWNVLYLPIMIASILFNFFFAKALRRQDNKSLLAIGILSNLALLGYFKYSDFFIENVNLLSGSAIPLLHLALPLAISFFTFQQIAYLVDSHKKIASADNLLEYSMFVTFFPQLIAGPIVHHKEMMPQFKERENLLINPHNIAKGLFIFSLGLFKKVVIADTFAIWAHEGFDVSHTLSFIEAWQTSLAYTFQLYYDFSGYTDMAIGLALLFNIRLPQNFNSPYKAANIQDFWRRWHMTLSRFLKDYIYIPLGGNRHHESRTYLNLFITFVLAGVWHGAGWTFFIWGLLHALALMVHRLWRTLGFKMHTILGWFLTFLFINTAWVFFRATSFEDAYKVLAGMVDISSLSFVEPEKGVILLFVAIMILTLFIPNSTHWLERFKLSRLHAVMIGMTFATSLLFFTRSSTFLYFNF